MTRLRRFLPFFVLALLLPACERETRVSVDKLAEEAKAKDEKLKRERADAAQQEKTARDALVAKLAARRPAVDQLFSGIYAALPDVKSLKRRECPDAKLTADTPDAEKRKVLVVNQETLWRLAGRADDLPPGAQQAFHSIAVDDGQWMVRANGKETPLSTRTPPESAAEAQARLEAIDFIDAHRYFGVAMFTNFKTPGGTGLGHVEGFTVIFDRQSKMPLCQIDAAADNMPGKTEVSSVGRQADEDLWIMYLHGVGKNLDAVTKVLTIEGVSKRKLRRRTARVARGAHGWK